MNTENNKNDFIFKTGDKVKHKKNNLSMVVVKTKTNYKPPYKEKIVCTYWNELKHIITVDEFYSKEIEHLNSEKT